MGALPFEPVPCDGVRPCNNGIFVLVKQWVKSRHGGNLHCFQKPRMDPG
jgi:hypothetical protein